MNVRLLFISRVALVCNLFFVLSAALQWRPFIANETVVSTIVVAGYLLAVFLFSPLVNLLYLVQWFLKRNLLQVAPPWLVVVNFSFLLVQILFILFYLNDTFHY